MAKNEPRQHDLDALKADSNSEEGHAGTMDDPGTKTPFLARTSATCSASSWYSNDIWDKRASLWSYPRIRPRDTTGSRATDTAVTKTYRERDLSITDMYAPGSLN